MRAAAKERGWNLNYESVALMWRGGCIIRSVFLGKIKEAFDANPGLTNLLLDPFFRDKVLASQEAWRRVVSTAILNGVPVPAFATALNYFDGFRAARLPANYRPAHYFGATTSGRTSPAVLPHQLDSAGAARPRPRRHGLMPDGRRRRAPARRRRPHDGPAGFLG
jgi:6-phosphogluconate dehydrogenase